MASHKSFMVASISSNPNSFGLHGHIMIAEDGEAWQIGRIRSGGHPKPWESGTIVEVPLKDDPVRHITVPAWDQIQCEIPERLPDAPTNVVAEIWNKPMSGVGMEPAPLRETPPSVVFTADQFTPTQWSTAQEKAEFANAFVRFAENNFQLEHFPIWFYRRLSQVFGHVAHFNQATFYRTFFSSSLDKLRFVQQTLQHQPVGDPAYTFSDVERVLRDWIVRSGLPERVSKTADHAQNRAEREQLNRMLQKHGLPDDFDAGKG